MRQLVEKKGISNLLVLFTSEKLVLSAVYLYKTDHKSFTHLVAGYMEKMTYGEVSKKTQKSVKWEV